MYTVGIGNIDVNELRDIASDPDDEHVFILSSFLDAAGFVDFLSVTTCDSKSSPVIQIQCFRTLAGNSSDKLCNPVQQSGGACRGNPPPPSASTPHLPPRLISPSPISHAGFISCIKVYHEH